MGQEWAETAMGILVPKQVEPLVVEATYPETGTQCPCGGIR